MDTNNDQQAPTINWKKQARDFYEELDEVHRCIVDLKLDNLAYIVIAEKIKEKFNREYKLQSLREMFIENGICYKAFVFLDKQKIIDQQKEKAKRADTMEHGAIKALQLLEQAVYDKTISENQIRAAESYLDRAGIPKQTSTKVENTGSLTLHHGLAQDIKSILEMPQNK